MLCPIIIATHDSWQPEQLTNRVTQEKNNEGAMELNKTLTQLLIYRPGKKDQMHCLSNRHSHRDYLAPVKPKAGPRAG